MGYSPWGCKALDRTDMTEHACKRAFSLRVGVNFLICRRIEESILNKESKSAETVYTYSYILLEGSF